MSSIGVSRAEGLDEACYKPLKRKSKYTVRTQQRQRPQNVKERIVQQREFENLRLESEHVAEFRYQPVKCKREYRMVVLRKNISHEKGDAVLFPEIRYFFYISKISTPGETGVPEPKSPLPSL